MTGANVGRALAILVLVGAPAIAGDGQGTARSRSEAPDIRLHPSALAQLIDELGGRHISLPRAKVISVINPRAFLVESAGPLAPTPGNLNRVVVLVDGGSLRIDPETLVGETVRVTGIARTIAGMQVSREVPWPPALTRDIVRRYEIRAAVLSGSVETPDGVQLVTQLDAGQ